MHNFNINNTNDITPDRSWFVIWDGTVLMASDDIEISQVQSNLIGFFP